MTAKVLTVLELYFGKENKEKCITIKSVSYTHLTLPTIA